MQSFEPGFARRVYFYRRILYYSDGEFGVVEGTESAKRPSFALPAGEVVRFTLSTRDEYDEFVCHWTVCYRTTGDLTTVTFGTFKRLSDTQYFADVPVLRGPGSVVPLSLYDTSGGIAPPGTCAADEDFGECVSLVTGRRRSVIVAAANADARMRYQAQLNAEAMAEVAQRERAQAQAQIARMPLKSSASSSSSPPDRATITPATASGSKPRFLKYAHPGACS